MLRFELAEEDCLPFRMCVLVSSALSASAARWPNRMAVGCFVEIPYRWIGVRGFPAGFRRAEEAGVNHLRLTT